MLRRRQKRARAQTTMETWKLVIEYVLHEAMSGKMLARKSMFLSKCFLELTCTPMRSEEPTLEGAHVSPQPFQLLKWAQVCL